MNQTLLPLAAALAFAFGSTAVHSQSLRAPSQPGDSLVRPVSPAPSLIDDVPLSGLPGAGGASGPSISTRGTVSGSVTQNDNSTRASSTSNLQQQRVRVGSALGVTGAAGSVSAQGTLNGSVVQTLSGSQARTNKELQTVDIGNVTGEVSARDVRANGSVTTSITQTANDDGGQVISALSFGQTVDVGSIRNAGGGSLVSNGVVTGRGVVQSQQGVSLTQQLRVASISGANVQDAISNGLVSGQVTQAAQGPDFGGRLDGQRVLVGVIEDSTAQTVTSNAQLLGDVSQSQTARSGQLVDLGSVRDTAAQSVTTDARLVGNVIQSSQSGSLQSVEIANVERSEGAGTIRTSGLVSGQVNQTAQEGATQQLRVATAFDTAGDITTRGVVLGDVTQDTSRAGGQTVDVASVSNSAGRVDTDATVGAAIVQTRTGNAGTATQRLLIGSVANSSGTVSTRAVVEGSVTQALATNGGNSLQRVEIGSVTGSTGLTARTDVTVNGDLVQTGTNNVGNQTIQIGVVAAN